MVKLGDVFKISSGGTPSKRKPEYYENGTIQWVRTGDLKDKYITKVEGLITEEALKNSSAKLFPADTVLIAMYGATIGACSILLIEAATNQACAAFLPNKEVDSSYLYFFLCSKKNDFINMGVGGAQPNISAKILKGIKFPLPPLETQKQIAKILDTAAELLTMRKQQLAELDNLIKSTFYEMFGDPVINEKGWDVKTIGDFSMVKIGPFGSLLHSEDYVEGGFPIVNPSNMVDGKIVPNMKLTLSTRKYEELQSYILKKGDIVVGRRGEIGRCAIVYDEGFMCGTGSMFIRIKKEYMPMVLQHILSSDTMRAKLEQQSVGITMKNLNAGTISNLEVPMIPLTLQNKFATIVTKIEEQKDLVKKAIDETQYMFDSLMSQYFD